MNSKQDRETRVRREIALLEKLKRGSAIFDFHWTTEPEEQLLVTFNGKGIVSRLSRSSEPIEQATEQATDEVEGVLDEPQIVDVHRVRILLPESFPSAAPEVCWQSHLLHPNVSFSGIVDLEELGSPWQPEMTLDVLCDRLWDVARLAYVNLPAATNNIASRWYENECSFTLPVDARPLRNRTLAHPQNVVSYRRLDKAEPVQPQPERELLFIGDDPPQPRHQSGVQTNFASSPNLPPEKSQTEDDGIYFVNE